MTLSKFSDFLSEGPVLGYRMTGGGRGKTPKKVSFWFCPPGQKKKMMGKDKPPKCLPKGVPTLQGAARLKKKFAIKKKVRTQRAKGAGYKMALGRKVGSALRARKKFGIKTPGR